MSAKLIIPNLRVDQANAAGGCIEIGFPAVTGFTGFVHAVQRRLRDQGHDVAFGGVAIIVADHELLAGHPKLPPSRADHNKGKGGASILDSAHCHMRVSLIVEIQKGEMVMRDAAAKAVVQDFLVGGRLCGGAIVSAPSEPAIADDDSDLVETLRRLKISGVVLLDRHDVLVAAATDPLDTILDAMEMHQDKAGGWHRRPGSDGGGPGWLVPVTVGYELIEEPKCRPTHRVPDGLYRHACGEPLTGLGEWRSLLRAGQDNFAHCYWAHHSDVTRGLLYVSARGPLSLSLPEVTP